MEELQSTDTLDREILEDARKKAQRILKTADETTLAKSKEWEKKTAESIAELEKKYGGLREAAAEKVMARLPIDKQRVKVEKIENMLNSAVVSWYEGLDRGRVLNLLSDELAKRLALCEEFSSASKKCAYIGNLDKKEAQTVLKKAGVTCDIKEISAAGNFPSITLETGNIRIIASIQNMTDFLLQEKREELVEALIGSAYDEGGKS